MRLIFIPGFGEDEFIFDKILPYLPGDKVVINNWKIIGDKPRPDINALDYAKEIAEKYSIIKEDIIIGHSMGGWIAYYIKHLIGCCIIQIGSWTDSKKVVKPIWSTKLIYFFVQRRWYFNSFAQRIILKLHYQNKPSCDIFNLVFERLKRANKNNVVNQLRIIYTPVKEKVMVEPDLRIHARADTVVHYPDEPTYKVPGDHFSLYTHPDKVAKPIVDFLNGF